jgi:hypothetical protein
MRIPTTTFIDHKDQVDSSYVCPGIEAHTDGTWHMWTQTTVPRVMLTLGSRLTRGPLDQMTRAVRSGRGVEFVTTERKFDSQESVARETFGGVGRCLHRQFKTEVVHATSEAVQQGDQLQVDDVRVASKNQF